MAELQQTISVANAEVECPAGWGKLNFNMRNECPISGKYHCVECEVKKHEGLTTESIGKDLVKK